MLTGLGEKDQQNKHDGQDSKEDNVHGVVAGVGYAHGLAYDSRIRTALGGQVGVQGGGGPETLAQDHAGVAAGHHHGEMETFDALCQMHGQNGGDDGAESPVQHGSDIAENHQHNQRGGTAVDQACNFVQQLSNLRTLGAGGTDNDHQAHLEGQGELAAQAIPPGDQEFQGALAAEDQRQDEDDKHQDHAKYEGIGNDLFGGEVKFLADPPERRPLGLGSGVAGHKNRFLSLSTL